MPPRRSTSKATPTKTTTRKTTTKAPASTTPKVSRRATGGGSGTLIIVESPAKAKTIKKLLGDLYQVVASKGHIRDLPEKKLGVDLKNNFAPEYTVMPDKAGTVSELQQAARFASRVYLAPDPDREGEAIAWHIAHLLNLPETEALRIEFHEITRQAIEHAIEHPRPINLSKVNAQQARRVLDRLVGYKLSPLLWQKVTKGLSAGRVQSVAVRLLCDREAEIEAFVTQEYWTVHGLFGAQDPNTGKLATFEADLVKVKGKKPDLTDEAGTMALLAAIRSSVATHPPTVLKLQQKDHHKNPAPPYITSTLQRDASNKLGYPVKKTMQIAQKLYEGIDIGGGPTGLITYMRTDSTRVADEAQQDCLAFIRDQYGAPYVPDKPRHYAQKKGNVQDAHEAIRPTSVRRTPQSLRSVLTDEQFRIYQLVWNRFVASQMAGAVMLRTTLDLECPGAEAMFRASHQAITFPGYLTVYQVEAQDDTEALADEDGKISNTPLPKLAPGSHCTLNDVQGKQHFTEPPPRYNEASLVKTMEELSIGRPSTYAPTIATIQDRGYVKKEGKALFPTELGKTVNKLLMEHFTDIVDTHFTAQMENRLDAIEEHHTPWQTLIQEFYEPFAATLKKASTEMGKVNVIIDNETCDKCGKPMALKTSRFGKQFLGCTGYPECSNIRPLTKDQKAAPPDRPTEQRCEKCNGEMVIRYGPYGDYFACLDEACKHKQKIVVKTGVGCPQCNKGELVQRKSRYGKLFYSCNQYPECAFAVWNKPIDARCPECSSLLVEKSLKKGNFHACSSKECKYQVEA